MLGYAGDEVGADLNEDWLNRLHPDDRHQVESAIAACTRMPTPILKGNTGFVTKMAVTAGCCAGGW